MHPPAPRLMRRGSSIVATGLTLLMAGPVRAQIPGVTLEEAIRLAEQVQPSVVQARGDVATTSALLRSAKGAYLPTLAATAIGSESYGGRARVDPTTGQIVTQNWTASGGATISSTFDLFTGFQRRAQTRAAKANTA